MKPTHKPAAARCKEPRGRIGCAADIAVMRSNAAAASPADVEMEIIAGLLEEVRAEIDAAVFDLDRSTESVLDLLTGGADT